MVDGSDWGVREVAVAGMVVKRVTWASEEGGVMLSPPNSHRMVCAGRINRDAVYSRLACVSLGAGSRGRDGATSTLMPISKETSAALNSTVVSLTTHESLLHQNYRSQPTP